MDIDGRDALDNILDRLESKIEEAFRHKENAANLEFELMEKQIELKTLREECHRLKSLIPAPASFPNDDDIPF